MINFSVSDNIVYTTRVKHGTQLNSVGKLLMRSLKFVILETNNLLLLLSQSSLISVNEQCYETLSSFEIKKPTTKKLNSNSDRSGYRYRLAS